MYKYVNIKGMERKQTYNMDYIILDKCEGFGR